MKSSIQSLGGFFSRGSRRREGRGGFLLLLLYIHTEWEQREGARIVALLIFCFFRQRTILYDNGNIIQSTCLLRKTEVSISYENTMMMSRFSSGVWNKYGGYIHSAHPKLGRPSSSPEVWGRMCVRVYLLPFLRLSGWCV